MRIRRGAAHVEVAAPAKLNLFLEILGKRADGFHEIETVMTPVSLEDTLVMTEGSTSAFELECEQTSVVYRTAPGAGIEVPTGPTNIVIRALETLRSAAGLERGARVRLIKRIPAAAGMAGGSTDAAAALAGANVLWNLNWPAARLAELAATLGSDIPFFFAGRPALCTGRGEIFEPLSVAPPLDFVVVKPPVGLSTADVYRACRPAVTPQSSTALIDAWRRGDKPAVGRLLHNRLQEAAEGLSEFVVRTARAFADAGCLGHRMSGSGTSYFGLCRNAVHARRTAGSLAARGLGRSFAVRTIGGPRDGAGFALSS